MRPLFCRTLVLLVLLGATLTGATITMPNLALIPSTTLYTDQIGGGIGSVLIMTGGGNAANVGQARNDDGFSGPINLGFTLNYFGQNYSQFFANNNGNISFGAGISAFVPTGPTGANAPVISPWFGDVDTRNAASGVMSLRTDIPNQVIVTWPGVGYFGSHGDKLNTFQLILRGPAFSAPGEGQIGFFWTSMPWEETDTSQVAAVGFGNGAGDAQVLQGSTQPGLNSIVQNHHIWFNLTAQGTPEVSPGTPETIPEPGTIALVAAGLAGTCIPASPPLSRSFGPARLFCGLDSACFNARDTSLLRQVLQRRRSDAQPLGAPAVAVS